jgi:hypothetical protein
MTKIKGRLRYLKVPLKYLRKTVVELFMKTNKIGWFENVV